MANSKVNSNEVKNGASIESIKRGLIRYFTEVKPSYFKENMYNRQLKEMEEGFQFDCKRLVDAVANGNFGLATEIAQTVNKYNRISEKQAYWIARAAWEGEISELFYDNGEIRIAFMYVG